MNLYFRELKAYRKSVIIWAVCMVLLVFMGVTKYSAAATGGGTVFNDMMKDMPASLQNFLGVGVFDLSKLVDYYGVLYLYLAMVLTIHAVLLGNGIISKEEKDKTTEFLLVKPVSRGKIITAKLLAGLTQVIFLNLVTWISSLLVFQSMAMEEAYTVPLLQMMAGLFGMQVVFLALGALIAAWNGKHKISSSIATGILLIMFFISVIIDMTGKLEFLRVFTIFKYFDARDILKLGYHFGYLLAAVLITVLCIFGTYFWYRKRDMKI